MAFLSGGHLCLFGVCVSDLNVILRGMWHPTRYTNYPPLTEEREDFIASFLRDEYMKHLKQQKIHPSNNELYWNPDF